MAGGNQIPEGTTTAAEKAVAALLKWKASKSKDKKPQLLESDEFLYLVVTLKKIPPKGRTNPYKIPLPHPLYSQPDSELCLFIDDRQGRLTSKSAKQKIAEDEIGVSKLIKLSKLKTDYKPFEAKRKLCDSYDLFLADKRVIPLLPKLIGRHFYKKKKIPVPVELGHNNWKEQIARACSSAFLFLKTGTCCVVRVAKCALEKDEIVENVVAAINGVAEVVPRKWSNVRSLHLKLSESLALPIYQSVPEMKLKIDAIVKGSSIGYGDEGKEVEKQVKGGSINTEKKNKKNLKKKGRIHEVRYMDTGDDELVDGEELGSEEEEEKADVVVRSKVDEMGSVETESKKGRKRKKENDEGQHFNKVGKTKKVVLNKKKEEAVAHDMNVSKKATIKEAAAFDTNRAKKVSMKKVSKKKVAIVVDDAIERNELESVRDASVPKKTSKSKDAALVSDAKKAARKVGDKKSNRSKTT